MKVTEGKTVWLPHTTNSASQMVPTITLMSFCSMRQKGQRQTGACNEGGIREERDLSTRHVTPGVLSHSSGELLPLPSARSKCGAQMTRNICHD